ncbi:MAG: MATE family efflux transporter [Tepidisphaeraceae bacterium]|jgi:MATE family multidrug resistance protein
MPDAPRSPLAELLALALPTVAQMASYTAMQFIDTWILSRLGDTPPTAASNSGMLAFAPLSLGMGTLVIVNALVSQSFGSRDFKQCGRFLWQGIWFGLIFSLLLQPLALVANPIFRIFHHPAPLAAMEATYFRIVMLAATVKLVSTSLGQFSLGIDRPNNPLVAAIIGVSINAFAAWCFVLGHCGFHSWGIAGAAWAQNLGCACEMIVLIILVFQKQIRVRFNALDLRPRWKEFITLLKVGVPSGLQWFSDVLAWSIFCNAVIGLIGPAAMAANAFMFRYLVLSFLPTVGLSAAVTALVGRYIGSRQPHFAARRAHLAFVVALAYVLICGIAFIAFRAPLMRFFTPDPAVIRIGSIYLIFAAIYEISDAMYIIYTGALRGAGDTFVPTVVMACLCWSISVFGGYAVARWMPSAGAAGPWIMGCIYGWILGLYMLLRFTGGKWRRIHLLQSEIPFIDPPAFSDTIPEIWQKSP